MTLTKTKLIEGIIALTYTPLNNKCKQMGSGISNSGVGEFFTPIIK